MNLFLDTSAFVKLYLNEENFERFREAADASDGIALSAITYVEFYSAIARREREKLLTKVESREILSQFKSEWPYYGKVPVQHWVLDSAREIVVKYALRSLDAIQLASALAFRAAVNEPVYFGSADVKLMEAAKREKFSPLGY